ncbi:LOW QUALITY PROTEIN: leucine-rich repeat and guanylate kinase domain-containing protein [Xenentodon cancila]
MRGTLGEQFSSASPTFCLPESTDAATPEVSSCVEVQDNNHMEKDDVLTAEMVSSHVSRSGCAGIQMQHVYQSLSLPSQNLRDISVLRSYVHLQKLEVPHNKIRDLSCVSHMPYLVILDASYNEIFNFFEFQPPKKLQEVNFSNNFLSKMKNLASYIYLCKMDLDYNSFSEITGLEQCCRLTHLSVAHNKLSRISGLDGLPLTNLCLRGNQLKRIEGLENVKSLRVLDLSLNRIKSLSGLQNLHQLVSINLEKNQIHEIQECKHIHDLFLVRNLSLTGNPVQEQLDYRLAVIFLLQHVTILDQEKVTAEEKVSSVNKYDPPMDLVAARDHMTQLVYQMLQPQVIYESTPPSAETSYPMLVLTGPRGCGKRELVHRLCQEFSEFFGYGICHTTRRPYFGEENGKDYRFVSEEEFQHMSHMGKFVQTMQYEGHQFGLSRDSIEDLAKVGLACCVHMELEGVFGLKKSCFEPQYILLIPNQVKTYKEHLGNRGLYTPAQIDVAVSRVDLYTSINTQRPGFIDKIIPCGTRKKHIVTKELASMRRRERLLRLALAGRSPGVYSQRFKRSDESRSRSDQSIPSSAGALLEPLDVSVLGQAMETLKDDVASSQTSEAPHPGINRLAIAASPSSDRRPGCDVKAILPPIPAGHKSPAPPSLVRSPGLSPTPTARQRGGANMEV